MAARADRIEAVRRDLAWLPRRENWRPPQQPDLMVAAYAYSGSTSAGTFSTTYTSSRGSLAGELASRGEVEDDEEKAKRRERAKGLLEGFCRGDGDIRGLERWLSELGVGWVLGLAADAPSAGTSLLHLALTERWIWALTEITGSTVRFVGEQAPVRLVRFLSLNEKARKEKRRLVTFVEATILKMLPFVDALLAAGDPLDAANEAHAPLGSKLQILMDVRDAVSSASIGIDLCFQSWDSLVDMETQRRSGEVLSILVDMETQRRSGEVLSILSAKEQRLDEAVWNTMEEVRTSILNDDDDTRWGIHTPQGQGSSDTCKVTRSLITYIKSLWDDYWRVNHIVRRAAKLGNYVPERDTSSYLLSVEQDKTDPLTTLTMEMVSSLQVKLAKRSESFPDDSLRLLFLINNTHFMWQHLHPLFRMKFHVAVLTAKIEEYIQKYLQVSWEPALSCLHTRHYCFRTNSKLPTFDSEFQKTYTAQKLWKVPDPELRTRLRKAIVDKVVSGLTRYLGDNNITRPRITPQEREEMLLELFEG